MSNTAPSYFEQLYAQSPDPWGFATKWYERRKYELTVASLPRERYRCAFEPGCSIGVLTEMMAPRCEELISFEMIPSAFEHARLRLARYANVSLELARIPESWPQKDLDLVVLSEIAYYFDRQTLCEVLDKMRSTTSAGSTVIAVHWRGETDYPLSGEEAHQIIDGREELALIVQHREPLVALDVWERRE